jgi:hypothetical protein
MAILALRNFLLIVLNLCTICFCVRSAFKWRPKREIRIVVSLNDDAVTLLREMANHKGHEMRGMLRMIQLQDQARVLLAKIDQQKARTEVIRPAKVQR